MGRLPHFLSYGAPSTRALRARVELRYKIEHKRPEDSRFANNVNFLACILLASDWFKDNQLLPQLTHAHYRDTVPLRQCGKKVAG